MPWSAATFKSRHNHGLSASKAEEASRVANALLRKYGDEGKAIRIANSVVKKAKGGSMKHAHKKSIKHEDLAPLIAMLGQHLAAVHAAQGHPGAPPPGMGVPPGAGAPPPAMGGGPPTPPPGAGGPPSISPLALMALRAHMAQQGGAGGPPGAGPPMAGPGAPPAHMSTGGLHSGFSGQPLMGSYGHSISRSMSPARSLFGGSFGRHAGMGGVHMPRPGGALHMALGGPVGMPMSGAGPAGQPGIPQPQMQPQMQPQRMFPPNNPNTGVAPPQRMGLPMDTPDRMPQAPFRPGMDPRMLTVDPRFQGGVGMPPRPMGMGSAMPYQPAGNLQALMQRYGATIGQR